MSEVRLEELLAPGVAADDVPELAPLLAARPLLSAFSTLFHGSEAEVLMRLLVLREIGRESESPRWSPEQLRQRFAFLDTVKLETVLRRLRGNGLLDIGEDSHYALSDLGRNAVAAVGMLVSFSAEDDLELGFLTAQLAGLQAVGSVTPEALGHLLGKLNDLAWHFEEAIASGSEFRIADARRKLSANTRWIERGTEVLHQLLADPEVPFDLARVAQRIGLAQSRLARVDAAFQRALNKIEAQRVTLGGSGISSSDVAGWLRRLDARALAALAGDGGLLPAPELTLLAGGHELLDRAELALSDEARQIEADIALPPAEEAPSRSQPEQEDLRLLQHFSQRLARLAEPGSQPASLAGMVAGGGFPAASYRLSLLALLADGGGEGGATPADGPIGEFMRLPLDVRFEATTVKVGEDEIAAMSTGLVGAKGSLPAAEAVPVLDATDAASSLQENA